MTLYTKPKKRFGQNFLIDKNIQEKIIEACELSRDDFVLEIGAGNGELTRLIAPRARSVSAIEIDWNLCKILKGCLESYKNVEIVNQDVLEFDFKKYFQKIMNLRQKIKVIGNIPYYITTPIIERLIEFKSGIDAVFITVQKEFALRLAACPGSKDYGSLSCFAQYYTLPEIVLTIKKTCFRPVPKVDSCLLKLKIREMPAVDVGDENLFFSIIRSAFNKRRKTLRNSLKDIVPEEKLKTFFEKYNINPKIRPEELALSDFADLTKVLQAGGAHVPGLSA